MISPGAGRIHELQQKLPRGRGFSAAEGDPAAGIMVKKLVLFDDPHDLRRRHVLAREFSGLVRAHGRAATAIIAQFAACPGDPV